MTAATLTDAELKHACFGALTALVGHVGMERFIVLLNREPRDYTKWRETHFCDDGETLDQLAAKIKAYVPPRRRRVAAPV